MSNTQHCLHSHLPNHSDSKIRKSPRNRGRNYILSLIETILFKNSFKQMPIFMHLVCILSCLILYLFFLSYFNIFAFMCLHVFTVCMLLSAYVMRATGMLFNKRPLTYLLTYLTSLRCKRCDRFI